MDTRRHPQAIAVRQRDAALARVGRTRRWTIAGTAALTAGFAGLVSAVAPGKSLGAKVTRHVSIPVHKAAAPLSAPALPPLASAGELGLQAPDQAPAPSTTPAPTPSTTPSPTPSTTPVDPSQTQADQAAAAAAAAAAQQPAVVSGGS